MKSLTQHINESYVNESINDKDWTRMMDLFVQDKDGAGTARTIKDKNKAINRYVAGLKLAKEELSFSSSGRPSTRNFKEFGETAHRLGATQEEIQKVYDENEIPEKIVTKTQELLGKNLSNWVTGPFNKKLLTAGIDFAQIGKGGNAKTEEGKDVMGRNGLMWTIGYTYKLKVGDKEYDLEFDVITSEALDNTNVKFVLYSVSDEIKKNMNISARYRSYGITEFSKELIKACNELK